MLWLSGAKSVKAVPAPRSSSTSESATAATMVARRESSGFASRICSSRLGVGAKKGER